MSMSVVNKFGWNVEAIVRQFDQENVYRAENYRKECTCNSLLAWRDSSPFFVFSYFEACFDTTEGDKCRVIS